MPRKAALDDPKQRNLVVHAIVEGETLGEAAKRVGISRRSLHNYIDANPDFAERINRARERAMLKSDTESSMPVPDDLIESTAPPPDPRPPPPSPAHRATAQMLGVDADLVQMHDELLGSDLIELGTRVDLSKPSPVGWLHVCWARMTSDRPDAVAWARLMQPVMTKPTLLAQERRDAKATRRELEAERREAAEEITGQADTSPILVVPPNAARPFLGPGTED